MAEDEARTPPKKGRLGTAGGELYHRPNSKVRLVSMQDLDRRTKAAQVAVETKTNIMADLGGEDRLSTLERIMAENAAMASAVLRDAYVRWIQGEQVPMAELATLQNSFNRLATALGLSRRAKDVTQTIDNYLEGKRDDSNK